MDPGFEAQRSAPPKPLYLWLWLVAAIALFFVTNRLGLWVFWDAKVYARAIHDWRIGQNPYSLADPALLFIYPPLFLRLGAFFAAVLPGHGGWFLYVPIYAACSLALPYLLARYYLRQSWLSPTCALVLVAMEPRFAGLTALRSGNISNIFYFVALAAAVPGLRRNRWTYFYLAVFLIAIVKLNFLVVLLIPLLIGRQQWMKSCLCALCAIATYPLQKIASPQLFDGFRTAMSAQIAERGSYGYGVMRIGVQVQTMLHHPIGALPWVLQIVFMLGLVAAMFALRRRFNPGNASALWIALVLLATILCNPRILAYDSDIGLLAGFVLLVAALPRYPVLYLAAAIFLPSVALQYLLHSSPYVGLVPLYETFTLLISLVAGYLLLWRRAGEPNPVTLGDSELATEA